MNTGTFTANGASTEKARLRRFSTTVAIGLLVIAALGWYRGHLAAAGMLGGTAIVLALLGLTMPAHVAPIEKVWMALARGLGWLNTRILLGVLFFLAFLPIGVVLRLFRDPLDRKLGDGRPSVWVRRPARPVDPKAYEHQF